MVGATTMRAVARSDPETLESHILTPAQATVHEVDAASNPLGKSFFRGSRGSSS